MGAAASADVASAGVACAIAAVAFVVVAFEQRRRSCERHGDTDSRRHGVPSRQQGSGTHGWPMQWQQRQCGPSVDGEGVVVEGAGVGEQGPDQWISRWR